MTVSCWPGPAAEGLHSACTGGQAGIRAGMPGGMPGGVPLTDTFHYDRSNDMTAVLPQGRKAPALKLISARDLQAKPGGRPPVVKLDLNSVDGRDEQITRRQLGRNARVLIVAISS